MSRIYPIIGSSAPQPTWSQSCSPISCRIRSSWPSSSLSSLGAPPSASKLRAPRRDPAPLRARAARRGALASAVAAASRHGWRRWPAWRGRSPQGARRIWQMMLAARVREIAFLQERCQGSGSDQQHQQAISHNVYYVLSWTRRLALNLPRAFFGDTLTKSYIPQSCHSPLTHPPDSRAILLTHPRFPGHSDVWPPPHSVHSPHRCNLTWSANRGSDSHETLLA
jgi:hypothetical protein